MQLPIAECECVCVRVYSCVHLRAEMWVALCCIKVCEHTNVKGAFANVPVVARLTLG